MTDKGTRCVLLTLLLGVSAATAVACGSESAGSSSSVTASTGAGSASRPATAQGKKPSEQQSRLKLEREREDFEAFARKPGGERLSLATSGGLDEHVHVGREARGRLCVKLNAMSRGGPEPGTGLSGRCGSLPVQRRITIVSDSESKHGEVLLNVIGYAGCVQRIGLSVDGRSLDAPREACSDKPLPFRVIALPPGRIVVIEVGGTRRTIRLDEFGCRPEAVCFTRVMMNGRPER